MADLNMLGKQQQNTVLFQRESDGQKKDVWFIWVDGGSDEGPAHNEVQFLWTENISRKLTHVLLLHHGIPEDLISILWN